MDPESEIKKQINPFYCNICKIWCSSALNLQTHFLGTKHRTVEEALKTHGMLKTESCLGKKLKTPGKLADFESCLGKKVKTAAKLPDFVPLEPEKLHGQTLEDQLNTCKDSEPALGLNYIIEYRTKDNVPFLYECQLCYCKTGLSNMFMHVCGSKHRLAYLRQHYPEIAQSDEVKGKGSELNKKVRQIGLTIEKKEGRKQIQVVIGVPTMRRKWQESLSAEDSPSKAKVQHVDVPLSNAEKTDNKDGKLTDSAQDENNVQEVNEERQKEQAKPDEKVEPNNAIEISQGNNSEWCETNKQSEEENKEAQQEFTADPEEFTSKEELLGYLQSFEILNEDDASFILKVTQTLTNALVEYRQQAASNKDHLGAGYNGEAELEYSTEQPGPTSADINDSDTDYSSSWSAKQFLPANEDEPQNFSTGSLETAYENNITTEFLNSVRNMNAEEVTDTLHRIAASNPAFRGIDIPNVIRILTESGTLRGPSNGSTQ
ncbi:uncharacterized protein LOC119696428 [Motacilla alba alba]|uniref:uncharacterized protein LOC119696428 n=1 Tax=Motacilla alba alba TaxID=1094192 RepID=UPI0018D58044|nr:uncharacterized protein LOC119696428 [Motacilla alba alba]XP_037982102.1 uncharacterized protein LOC119696428 [Motacilla alba alba]XP_037982109.1 uncharacterized protein LOC119696428 [Motacilla alba alba]XP_037982117.1 uncharacterized protein LOC119696428 [Motacilla alba alba]XP_037982118.1 uncharacterized protein LOC119696428 [Motacilla alba alba]XP_037982128.1 uncharacterized protein LOC119696428 [Motacilla alba alba]